MVIIKTKKGGCHMHWGRGSIKEGIRLFSFPFIDFFRQ
jgi:hypothetical protein